MPDPIRDTIRTYYDQNTRLFLRFGSSRQAKAIHRALWMPGITSLAQALHVSTNMLQSSAHAVQSQRIADLGCGVGATLFFLLTVIPEAHGFGLTISPVQARLGARYAPPNAHLLEADFQRPPLSSGFDLVYSIEAFVHASSAEEYLSESARLLRPGGRLALLDDFLTQPNPSSRWIDLYQRGWHTPNLRPVSEVVSFAAQHRLRLLEDLNLTPYLRLRPLPDSLAKILKKGIEPLWSAHPIVPSMLGSMALQQCLRDGAITYNWLLFEKCVE